MYLLLLVLVCLFSSVLGDDDVDNQINITGLTGRQPNNIKLVSVNTGETLTLFI